MEISSAYLNLQALKQALDVSSKNVVAAGERRKINTERYNLGSGTILDVLQADKDYTDAVRNNIDVKFQYYSAKDALVNALGKLDFNNYEE
jgi:outer membrane protein